MKKKKSNLAAPFAYEGLDRVIHERARLSVLTSLMTHPGGLSFVELKQQCGLTDGNLARHLQVLEQDGLVSLVKESDVGRAQTMVRVTVRGKKRFVEYLGILEQVVKDAVSALRRSDGGRMLRELAPADS